MNDLTELPSVLPKNHGGSFNFTEDGNPCAHCNYILSTPTSLVSAAS